MPFQILFSYGGGPIQKYSTYESAVVFASRIAEHNPGEKLRIIFKDSDAKPKLAGKVWFDQSGLHQEKVDS